MSPRSAVYRVRPAVGWPALGWLSCLALVVGCGGALKSVEAPRAVEPIPADPSSLPILLEPAAPARLAPFAVNPTVAVAARPGLQVAPVADRSGWWSALAALKRGGLPDARPEAFVDALVGEVAGPILGAAWAPSPYRPGYHGLRLLVMPPPGPPPPAAIVVVEARRAVLDTAARQALAALAGRRPAPTLGLLVAAEQPRWVIPLQPPDPQAWSAAVDALDLAGPADLDAAIAAARGSLPPGGVVVVVADPERRVPVDGPVARVGSATELLAAVSRRPWLSGSRLTVDLDGRQVERYRLIGFDGGAGGGRAPTLWAGRPTAILLEVALRPDHTRAALGRVQLHGLDAGGRPITHSTAIEPAGDDERRVAVALLAAAVAEKLRAAWWARALDWTRLAADARALEGAPGIERLVPVIERAMAVDRRPDRFADYGAVDAMDPDAVPILRSDR